MSSRTHNAVDWIGLVLLAAIVGLILWNIRTGGFDEAVARGTPLPPLDFEGWVNQPPDEPFDPAGELVVVDCWATWCGPCRRDMPRMVRIAADYRPLGVKFLGVTQETGADVPTVEKFIAQTPGFDWPVGYGAFRFMNSLELRGIPTVILFGRDGQARWSGFGSDGLEAALDEALAVDEPA